MPYGIRGDTPAFTSAKRSAKLELDLATAPEGCKRELTVTPVTYRYGILPEYGQP